MPQVIALNDIVLNVSIPLHLPSTTLQPSTIGIGRLYAFIGTQLAAVSVFRSQKSGASRLSVIAIKHDQIAELFLTHKEAIVDFLLRKVKCPDAAQDLSQETYLRLLGKDSLTHTDNLPGYLFRTAERLSIDFIRHHQRSGAKTQELDDELTCPLMQPEDFAILSQQCERLLQAIASLPRQCRHILLLRKIDELTYAQIAGKLGISEKTVQRQLVKAMLHCHHMLIGTQH